MKTHQYPVDLTDEQIEEFGNELEAIRNEVFDSRGDRDRASTDGLANGDANAMAATAPASTVTGGSVRPRDAAAMRYPGE